MARRVDIGAYADIGSRTVGRWYVTYHSKFQWYVTYHPPRALPLSARRPYAPQDRRNARVRRAIGSGLSGSHGYMSCSTIANRSTSSF